MNLLCNKVVKKLIKKKLTISTAESCTGGLLASSLTSIKGSSSIFNLGLVTYSNKSKVKVLRVPKDVIKKYGSVSEKVCLSMLKNLSKISKTRIALTITGIAGPGGGSKKKPVGLVFIGFKNGNKITIIKNFFQDKGRIYIQKATVKKSLKLIFNSIK
jgi:PncC family amidohydrolase